MRNKYYTQEDLDYINRARNFIELSEIALRVIRKMPQPIVQACGPIATGGTGSLEMNLKIFGNFIQALVRDGKNVFDQMPFEEPMQRLKKEEWYRGGDQVLVEFYLPIFESGLIKRLYFIPRWETSFGASWEHEQAIRLGIEIVYL